MAMADQPDPRARGLAPTPFLATAALHTMHDALRSAQTPREREGEPPEPFQTSSEQALTALLLLREVRDQLAEWEPGLIEGAREAGASWADLAHPLGVSSRQAAERRYLRVRPGSPGSTGEQRVRATRDRRAADRTVTAWARANAADLRQLAGQITALTDLPAAARSPLGELTAALAENDAAALVGPLALTHAYLASGHPDLAARVDDVARHTDGLRRHSGDPSQEPRKSP
ncbi:type III effector protein [Streptomyces sp. Qhu-G9]|uniref:type III effector protein n=1 Tax=Streptomyces sp. Qhu-G9 TaxID=3452799 RepID=UPI0022AC1F27|nr:type III effector protein [Streptomyces aurantiacus]WAU83132.1 type III effector protein [Streptomyces aurantiacus]